MIISEENIKYSLKNLYQRKSRSLLTIVSIFVGIMTIFVFISFGLGLYSYVGEFTTGSSADKVIIQPRGSGMPGLDNTFALTDDDLDAISKTSGVYEASGVVFKVVEVEKSGAKKYTFMMGYDPKTPLIMEFFDMDMDKGRWLKSGEKNKAIFGYNYQIDDRIFSRGYDLNDNLKVDGGKIKAVGFFESVGSPPDDAQIYVTNDFIEELYPNETISYGWIIARVDPSNIDNVVENIEKNLRKERDLEKGKEDFYVQSFQDMMETYANVLNGIVGFIILIALISVFVSAINTANTMITSVLERYKEIGIIKSIGARNSEIFKIFLFESGFLGFVAGVVGVWFGFSFSFIGGKLLTNLGWGFLSPSYPASLFIGCILFATITGAISGVIPAMKASKINPVDALRYE